MSMLDPATRNRFDRIFEDVLASAPQSIQALIEEVPVILDDRPSEDVCEAFDLAPDELCGMHSGIPLTERSVEDSGVVPDVVYLYRRGIIAAAGGPESGDDQRLRDEIRITLLHEIGHHFGLTEKDLESMGFA